MICWEWLLRLCQICPGHNRLFKPLLIRPPSYPDEGARMLQTRTLCTRKWRILPPVSRPEWLEALRATSIPGSISCLLTSEQIVFPMSRWTTLLTPHALTSHISCELPIVLYGIKCHINAALRWRCSLFVFASYRVTSSLSRTGSHLQSAYLRTSTVLVPHMKLSIWSPCDSLDHPVSLSSWSSPHDHIHFPNTCWLFFCYEPILSIKLWTCEHFFDTLIGLYIRGFLTLGPPPFL